MPLLFNFQTLRYHEVSKLKLPLLGTYVFLYLLLIGNGLIDLRRVLPPALLAAPLKVLEPIFLFIVYVGVPLIVGLVLAQFRDVGRRDKLLLLVVALIAFDAITKTWVTICTSQVWQKILANLGGNGSLSLQFVLVVWGAVVFVGWVMG